MYIHTIMCVYIACYRAACNPLAKSHQSSITNRRLVQPQQEGIGRKSSTKASAGKFLPASAASTGSPDRAPIRKSEGPCTGGCDSRSLRKAMANLRTKIPDFRGFDSSRILISRGGILMSMWNFPERSSQRILVGIILVGRLGARLPLAPKGHRGRAGFQDPRDSRLGDGVVRGAHKTHRARRSEEREVLRRSEGVQSGCCVKAKVYASWLSFEIL